jgi:hypothetical protein
MTKKQQKERDEARAALREILKPGDTVTTILRHVSRSGMLRHVDVIIPAREEPWKSRGEVQRITYHVALAAEFRYDRKREAIAVQGCGMDVGFEVVYNLSRALFHTGQPVPCIGEGCPANDHSNGDHDYTAGHGHHPEAASYMLRHRWA